MPILQHTVTTYTVTLTEIKKLIAADLQVPESKVEVHYNLHDTSDDRLGGYPSYAVKDLSVTVAK